MLSTMVDQPPKTLFAFFLKSDGTASTSTALFKGEVVDGKLFMDTKHQQVYIVFQVPTSAVNLTTEGGDKHKQYPYTILLSKTNATGARLTLGRPKFLRYVVGYTRERNAHIDGYFNRKNGWYVPYSFINFIFYEKPCATKITK